MRGDEGGATAVRRRGMGPFGCLVAGLVVAAVLGVAGFLALPLLIKASADAGLDVVTRQLERIKDVADGDDVDRSSPPVLKTITDLNRFEAAQGYFEVVVDKSDNDGGVIPDWLDGERVIYVGKGTVDVTVDLSNLSEDRVTVSEDRRSVSLRLPQPELGEPNLNIEAGEVKFRDEGFLNRFRGSDLERRVLIEAEKRILESATGQADLIGDARENTTRSITEILQSLGFTDVTVTFDKAA